MLQINNRYRNEFKLKPFKELNAKEYISEFKKNMNPIKGKKEVTVQLPTSMIVIYFIFRIRFKETSYNNYNE